MLMGTENAVANITPGMLVAAVLAICAAIVTISNAAEKIVKAYKAAKAPNEAQNARLDDHEKRLKAAEEKLDRDRDRLRDIDDGNRVTQRALLALLDHGIDGNNIKQMQDAKEALQDHLINHH